MQRQQQQHRDNNRSLSYIYQLDTTSNDCNESRQNDSTHSSHNGAVLSSSSSSAMTTSNILHDLNDMMMDDTVLQQQEVSYRSSPVSPPSSSKSMLMSSSPPIFPPTPPQSSSFLSLSSSTRFLSPFRLRYCPKSNQKQILKTDEKIDEQQTIINKNDTKKYDRIVNDNYYCNTNDNNRNMQETIMPNKNSRQSHHQDGVVSVENTANTTSNMIPSAFHSASTNDSKTPPLLSISSPMTNNNNNNNNRNLNRDEKDEKIILASDPFGI